MKLMTFKRCLWIVCLFISVVALAISITLLLADATGCLVKWQSKCELLDFLSTSVSEALNTAIANSVRVVGTGAVLTLLVMAADHTIGTATVRDILVQQYLGLRFAYCFFFILILVGSFAGDCCCSAAAVISGIGVGVLSVWFYVLPVKFLLDTKGQIKMAFDYFANDAYHSKCGSFQQGSILQNAVKLAKSEPKYCVELSRVFRAAIKSFKEAESGSETLDPDDDEFDLDEDSKRAAYSDQWDKVCVINAIETLEMPWRTLRNAGQGLSVDQLDAMCGEILMDLCSKRQKVNHVISEVSFIHALLPWDKDGSYLTAHQNLETFCRSFRTTYRGDERAEKVISNLACIFGLTLSIALVNRNPPSWVDQEDLAQAWKQFAAAFCTEVFSSIDNAEKEELHQLLQYAEWSVRKKLHLSWVNYDDDRLNFVAKGRTRAELDKEMSNSYLLDFLTNSYISTGGIKTDGL